MSLDPAIQTALRLDLALLFAFSAWHKLRDPVAFRSALASYALLPRAATHPAAAGLVGVELGVAIAIAALAAGAPWGWSTGAAAGLLALYTTAIAINLARGRRDIDCGCAGPDRRRTLSGSLVLRNLALLLACAAAAAPGVARAFVWIDGVTIAGTAVAFACLYAALETALGNTLENARRARLLGGSA